MTERTPLVLIGGVKKQLPAGDTLAKSIVGLGRADNTPDLEKPVSQPTQDALARKADLDSGGKVSAVQLPSYIDDVLEYNTFADLPGTGEAGKIYVTLDPYTDAQGLTSSQFRWSGSAYTPIIASPGTTDAVTEGSSNLYFTTNRVRQVLLAGLSTAVGGVIAATDNIMQALGKLQNQITGLNKASVGLDRVDNTSDSEKPLSGPQLSILNESGSENLIYNSAFRKNANGLADGFLLEASSGGTGVASIVPSFISANEFAQRVTATGLQVSSPYRSIMLSGARRARVAEGRPFIASSYVRGTAGMGIRMYIRAINGAGAVITTYNSIMFTFTGDAQRVSLSVPTMPAGTVSADVFYRFHGLNQFTDGFMELARPQAEIGPLSGWSEDLLVLNEEVAQKAAIARATLLGPVVVASQDTGSGDAALLVVRELTNTASVNLPQALGLRFTDKSKAARLSAQLFRLAYARDSTATGGPTSFDAMAVLTPSMDVNTPFPVRGLVMEGPVVASGATLQSWTAVRIQAPTGAGTVSSKTAIAVDPNAGNSLFGSTADNGVDIVQANGSMSSTGPHKVGQYTLTTLPSAAAYNGYEIDVTNATVAAAGPKRCRSNGTSWLVLNTNTPVS
jgi:hypothetical protein